MIFSVGHNKLYREGLYIFNAYILSGLFFRLSLILAEWLNLICVSLAV